MAFSVIPKLSCAVPAQALASPVAGCRQKAVIGAGITAIVAGQGALAAVPAASVPAPNGCVTGGVACCAPVTGPRDLCRIVSHGPLSLPPPLAGGVA
ncbi:hypothetical protein [Jannaschia sp. M317]|uniref:hypothetical protein n=1 Tax=Jannaschia sp. M317 TaxID=2867011 RepID=UPI0021A496BF|nr:hypothetical protein [Jannaschia sp. M317]UWQ19053.1 hypothetical protein K3551_07210 [Jannaschia sp. M317]